MLRMECGKKYVLLMSLLISLPLQAATITIDPLIQYQRITGFGVFDYGNDGGTASDWVNDLGLTVIRTEISHDFKAEPGDSYDIYRDVGGYCTSDCASAHAFNLRAIDMQNAADAAGEPLTVIASCWSPPYWMKYNSCVRGDDHLWNRVSDGIQGGMQDMYPALAEFFSKYVQAMIDDGVRIDAVSFQNEPDFAQWYKSCVYSASQYSLAMKVIADRMDQDGLGNVKFFGPEDVQYYPRIAGYVNAAHADPEARADLDIVAIHGYHDGVNADDTSEAQWIQTFEELAIPYNKPLWMTETSGYYDTYEGQQSGDEYHPGALDLAGAIHKFLRAGNGSAWVWWSGNSSAPGYGLKINGQKTRLWYASKQYYRFIRPDAVMIQAASDDPELWVTAFHHPDHHKLILVLINTGYGSKSISLAGSIPSQFNAWRTSSSENCVLIGTVSGNFNMPARSVVTLDGGGYSPAPVNPLSFRIQPQPVTVDEGSTALFTVRPAGSYPYEVNLQWQRDGEDIPGEVWPQLAWTNAAIEDDGSQFTVVISDGQNAVTSDPAALTVTSFQGAQVRPADQTIIIDGQADDAWTVAQSYPFQHVINGTVSGTSDLSGKFKVLWDDNYMYLLATVTDDTRIAPVDPATCAHCNDSIELYFDGDNGKTSGYEDDDFQYVFVYGGNGFVEVKHNATAGVAFDTVDISNGSAGYQLEARLSWSTLQTSPACGQFIGIDVHVNDNDGGSDRQGKMAWFNTEDTSWQSPANFGTGKLLTGDPLPPPTHLQASHAGNAVELSWQDHADDEDGYLVERKPYSGSDNWHELTQLPANSEAYTDTDSLYGLVPYTYRVGVYRN